MALYMIQFAYTSEAWASLTKNPQDRRAILKEAAQQLGGQLVGLYYCFGEYDGVLLAEVPDETSALTMSLSAIAQGHLKMTKTTRLITVEETMEAMRRAGRIGLQGPRR